jgi:hypothetical protein
MMRPLRSSLDARGYPGSGLLIRGKELPGFGARR